MLWISGCLIKAACSKARLISWKRAILRNDQIQESWAHHEHRRAQPGLMGRPLMIWGAEKISKAIFQDKKISKAILQEKKKLKPFLQGKRIKDISPPEKNISSTFFIGYDKEKNSKPPPGKTFKRPSRK